MCGVENDTWNPHIIYNSVTQRLTENGF